MTSLIYAQTLSFSFVHDDLNFTDTWLEPIGWPRGINRMLTGFSHGLGYALSGVEPWGHHAVSVGVHLVNGALLWSLMAGSWVAVFALGLFLLHPLQVESVAYISARPDLLLVTVILLAIAAVERRWIALGFGIAACGVLVKEAGIALVPLLCLWVWRSQPRALWWALPAGVFGLFTLWAFLPQTLDPHYTAIEITKVWLYGIAFMWPLIPLSIEMPWQGLYAFEVWPVLVSTVFVTWAAIIAALGQARERWAFAVLWCALALGPRLLVPLLEGLHAHHLAVPIVGLALAIGVEKGRHGCHDW